MTLCITIPDDKATDTIDTLAEWYGLQDKNADKQEFVTASIAARIKDEYSVAKANKAAETARKTAMTKADSVDIEVSIEGTN